MTNPKPPYVVIWGPDEHHVHTPEQLQALAAVMRERDPNPKPIAPIVGATGRTTCTKCECREIDFVSAEKAPWVEFRCPQCGLTHWLPF